MHPTAGADVTVLQRWDVELFDAHNSMVTKDVLRM
jgi:hypothetical protein